MEQYKHKKLGWIADKDDGNCWYSVDKLQPNSLSNITGVVPKELIEDSNDREEIKEEDWTKDLYDSLDGLYGKQLTEEEAYPMFIERLNKHLPRITDDMIEKMRNDYMNSTLSNKYYFIEAIKQNLPKDLLANPE